MMKLSLHYRKKVSLQLKNVCSYICSFQFFLILENNCSEHLKEAALFDSLHFSRETPHTYKDFKDI